MNSSNNGAIGQQQPPISNQPTGGMQLPGMASAIEHYRLSQLYQYAMAAERLRGPPGSQSSLPNGAAFFPPISTALRPELAPFLYSSYCRIDPRLALCRPPDEPKPQHSYIGLIAMAILGSPDKKLVLSDIYQYILDNYPYFRSRGPGWRNSIRHNLSLNDCFVKSGRSANGKGHYWAIHPANIDDFTKGDFRRRKAQRKVRRHMGLAVDDPDSPSPPPVSPPPVNWPDHPHHPLLHPHPGHHRQFPPPHFALLHPHAFPISAANTGPNFEFPNSLIGRRAPELLVNSTLTLNMNFNQLHRERKRQFDVASLLAPENDILGKDSPGLPVSPVSTSKSVKSDDDCENEQCLSRTPSPMSPMCKTVKKMSPPHSEEDQISDDEGKGGRKQSAKNSSDDDEETGSLGTCSRNYSAKGATSTPGPFVEPNGHLSPDNPPPGGIQFREDRRANSSIGCCHHDSNVNKVSSTSSPLCQSHDPILQQHLGLPTLHSQVGHGFNPNYQQHLLQHNPSLASLMLLSSRYREIASGMALANKKPH